MPSLTIGFEVAPELPSSMHGSTSRPTRSLDRCSAGLGSACPRDERDRTGSRGVDPRPRRPPAMRALSSLCVMRALSSPPCFESLNPLVLLGNKPDTRDRNRRHPEGRTVESDCSNALAAAHRPGSAHDDPDEPLAEIRRIARQSASYGHHARTISEGKTGMPFAIFTMCCGVRGLAGRVAVGRSGTEHRNTTKQPAHALESRCKRHSLALAITWRCRDWLPREETTEVMGADAV